MKKISIILCFFCVRILEAQPGPPPEPLKTDEIYEVVSFDKDTVTARTITGLVYKVPAYRGSILISGDKPLRAKEIRIIDSTRISMHPARYGDTLSIKSQHLVSYLDATLISNTHLSLEVDKITGDIAIVAGLFGSIPKEYPLVFHKSAAKSGQIGESGNRGGNGRNAGGKIKWGIPRTYGSTGGGNGGNGQSGQNGQNGMPGISGEAGRSAGNILLKVNKKISKKSTITFYAQGKNGADGTMGQNGGNGGSGGNGGRGGNGGGAAYDRRASRGGSGGNGGGGGNGGSGGHGGHGGKGGDGGNVTIDYTRKAPSWDWFVIKTSGGEGGKGGPGGFGGKKGKGGNRGNGGNGGDGSFFKHGGSSGLAGRPGSPGKNGKDGKPGEDGPVGRDGIAKPPIVIIKGTRATFPWDETSTELSAKVDLQL